MQGILKILTLICWILNFFLFFYYCFKTGRFKTIHKVIHVSCINSPITIRVVSKILHHRYNKQSERTKKLRPELDSTTSMEVLRLV